MCTYCCRPTVQLLKSSFLVLPPRAQPRPFVLADENHDDIMLPSHSLRVAFTLPARADVIGTVAGIFATLDPNGVMFHTTMDALNVFMRERRLDRSLRIVLRDYFNNARRVHQVSDDAELLSRMSPFLQVGSTYRTALYL